MEFVLVYTLSLLVSVVSAFHIVPPASIATCEPLTIGYNTTGGQAPFSLSFHNGSADGLVAAAFTEITGASYTWDRVTIPAGINIVIVLGDSRGVGSATPVILVSRGSYDVCLGSPTSIPPITSVTSTTNSLLSSSTTTTNIPWAPTMGPTLLWPPDSIGSTSGIDSTGSIGTTSSISSTGSISSTSSIGNTAGDFTIGAIAIGAITAIVAAVLA